MCVEGEGSESFAYCSSTCQQTPPPTPLPTPPTPPPAPIPVTNIVLGTVGGLLALGMAGVFFRRGTSGHGRFEMDGSERLLQAEAEAAQAQAAAAAARAQAEAAAERAQAEEAAMARRGQNSEVERIQYNDDIVTALAFWKKGTAAGPRGRKS